MTKTPIYVYIDDVDYTPKVRRFEAEPLCTAPDEVPRGWQIEVYGADDAVLWQGVPWRWVYGVNYDPDVVSFSYRLYQSRWRWYRYHVRVWMRRQYAKLRRSLAGQD